MQECSLDRLGRGGQAEGRYSKLGQRACPVFSWDRVNFHNKLVGLTQAANQMGYSIPCDATLSI